MVGQIDISPDGSCLLVSFPYQENLVSLVRSIPGRRWDRSLRVWKVPLERVEDTVKIFMAHGFGITPSVATALATDGKDTGPTGLKLGDVEMDPKALTVSALNLRMADCIAREFKEPFWVVGELQNFDKGRRGKHKYFELVEKTRNELGEDKTRSVVSAVIFDRQMALIRTRLKQSGSELTLEDGIKVRVRGKVEVYQPRGRYQLIIDDIDPSYTLGEQILQRERILKELEEAGLAKRNLELPMPRVPLRIALVTAEHSDAFNDFAETLAATRYFWQVMLYPVRVQGEDLRPTVLRALRFFAESQEDFDVCVICRGGGSRSELGWWDDRDVARAVAEHPVKILVGIGHERDRCVLDFIAESVKTPTAAAELLLERVKSYQEKIEDCMLEVAGRAEGILSEEFRTLRNLGKNLRLAVRAGLAGSGTRLKEAGNRLARSSLHRCRDEGRLQDRRLVGMQITAERRLDRAGFVLRHTLRRLFAGSGNLLVREAEILGHRETQCRNLDPERVLSRGFAILRGGEGRALRSVRQTKEKALLEARLSDGGLSLRVEEIRRDSQ